MTHANHGKGRAAAGRGRCRAGKRPLSLEVLEDRTLLSAAAPGLPGPTVDPTNILVQFRDSSFQPASLSDLPGTNVGQSLALLSGWYVVNLSAGVTPSQALAAYGADPRVALAQLDYVAGGAAVPNDPSFGSQYALQNTGQNAGLAGADVNATQAWNTTTGAPSVTVAVLDTGVDYDHPDLYQNIWLNQAEIPLSRLNNLVDVDHDGVIGFDDLNNPINQGPGKITDVNHDGRIDAADILAPMVRDSQGHDAGLGGWAFPGNTRDGDTAHPNDFFGWNFVANNNNPFDDNGHGTHVSGIIGAMGNNGVGVAGVEWSASLMPLKFLDGQGNGNLPAYLDALSYAIKHGARVLNNSWAGFGDSSVLKDAIAAAQAQGAIFVFSAGNDGANLDATPSFPSSFKLNNMVSVAATDDQGRLASFSNYGAGTVALAAPGLNILSTLPNGQYGYLSGTSMAAPFVSGALALVWGEHPGWTYRQVIDQVLKTVRPLASLDGKTITGGQLDLGAAVAVSSPAPTLQVLGSAAGGPSAGTITTIRLTFNAAVDLASLKAPGAVTLVGPGGQAIVVTGFNPVGGSNGTQVDLTFAPLTTPGDYSLTLAPLIDDTTGHHLAAPYKGSFTIGNPTPGLEVIGSAAGGLASNMITGIRVAFNAPIDLSSLQAAGALTLIGPNGQRIAIDRMNLVAGTNGRQVDMFFAAQTAPGKYTLTLATSIHDLAGRHLAAPIKLTFTVTAPTGTYTNPTSMSIPDLGIAISPITVPQDVTVRSIQVRINIQHPFDGDLYIHLVAPNGIDILLSNRQGGAGHNFQNTLFDDNAPTSIRNGTAPFAGSYQPESQLSNLIGMNAKGTWRLWVEDRSAGDVGKLLSWSLILNGNGPASPASTGARTGQSSHGAGSKNPTTGSSGKAHIAVPRSARDAVVASTARVNSLLAEFGLASDEGRRKR
jgi:subtilisin family serine protease/subtilisin-like proprotein convertase family protein